MSLLVFTGHRFLAEEAMREEARQRELPLNDWPQFREEEVSLQNIEPHLAPGLFGDGGLMVDLNGLKPDKTLLAALTSAQVAVVLLDAKPLAARLKVYNKAGAEMITSAAPQKTGEITKWVLERAKKQQIKMGRDAAQYLADVFGSDLASIASELNKLTLLDGSFTQEQLKGIVGREPPGDSFSMLGAATTGQTKVAILQLRRLIAAGEEPFRIMGAVVWQYSLIARCVALMSEEGLMNEAAAAKKLGIKPYPAKKALSVARKINEKRMLEHLKHILEADVAMKSGLDAEKALERLIVQLSF